MFSQNTGQVSFSCQDKDTLNYLPANIAGVIEGLSKKLGWNKDYCLLPMIVAAGGAIGSSRHSSIAGYRVLPILYGCSVGFPSVNKSEPLAFAVQPLRDLFKKRYAEFQERIAGLSDDEKKKIEPLVENVFSDITIEKVGYNLQHNPKGALLAVDELKGFFNSIEKQKSNAGQKYLELFNGNPLTDSRMSRATVHVPNPRLSIIGTMQPDVIHRLFRDAADDGTFERFLFVYPKSKARAWSRSADWQQRKNLADDWKLIVNRLYGLPATDESNTGFIPFSEDAEDCLFEWQEGNTERKNEQTRAAAILGKADIIVPRLALILQCIEDSSASEISKENAIRAISLYEDVFLPYTLKIRQVILNGADETQNFKLELHNALPDKFSLNDAYKIATKEKINVSQRTVRRYLADKDYFTGDGEGNYERVQLT